MKKRTLLTVTALTLACLGNQPLTAMAAPQNNAQVISRGNKVIITYRPDCTQSLQDILDKLLNCNPGNGTPDNNTPDNSTPDNSTSDNSTPDNSTSDNNTSDNNTPDNNTPDNNTPDNNTPDNNIPDNSTSDNNTSDNEIPDGGAPDNNAPDSNAPDNNAPDNNAPDSSLENAPSTEEHAFIQEVVNLVNAERAKEGLAPLTIDTKVQAAAQVRAKECEKHFSHTRPNGSSFSTALKEQNVSYRSAGENIAWGQRTPREVVTAWMNSPGHRANIMNAGFTTIGVGYYENARGTDYWCQLFTR